MSPSKGSARLLDAALEYAKRGWPVLPLQKNGKAPRTSNGLLDASPDPERVRAWWSVWPYANIGLRTGVAFDVLDIDGLTGNTAITTHTGKQLRHDGPISITGKGWHLLFNVSGMRNGAKILQHLIPEGGDKVDFRGENGYIVAPPSIHPSGHPYFWDKFHGPDADLANIPDWLRSLLDPIQPPYIPKEAITYDDTIHGTVTTYNRERDSIIEAAINRGMNPIRRGRKVRPLLCPFHQEDTPSFVLYPEQDRFYCFGCHAWGDTNDLILGKPAGHK